MDNDDSVIKDQKRLGFGMVVVMWVIIFIVLALYFSSWLDEKNNPNQRVLGSVTKEGVREITLKRNRYGHYVASGRINGKAVEFMLDTGATDISIPAQLAEELGLTRGIELEYKTANGTVIAYATRLESVSMGDIDVQNVRASINPNMQDTEILLGMTFLKTLEFSQRGDILTLRQYPTQ